MEDKELTKPKKDRFTGRMFRQLWLPSVISYVGLAFGDIADAVVVGRKMGATGLAAISICLPIYMIMNVSIHGLGLGGSTRYSKYLGEGKKEEAVLNFNRIIQAAIVISVILALLGNLFIENVLAALGTVPADGELYLAAKDYAVIIITGIPTFFLAYIINYYLRNDDNQKLASVGFTIANAVDIALNIIFVLIFEMDAAGAALSTVIGQIVAIMLYIPGITGKNHILKLKWCIPDIKEVWDCFRGGFSTAVYYICQLVFLLIMNHVLMNLSGEKGVAVFDMLQNTSYLVLYLYEGTAKAMQPLISTYCGEHNHTGMKETLKNGLVYGQILGSIMISIICIFPQSMCSLFGLTDAGIIEMGVSALRIYCVGTFFGGMSILIEGYYQACENEKAAFILTTLRGTIILIPCAVLFIFLGMEKFWWLFPVTEIVSIIVFAIWKKLFDKKKNEFDLERIYSRTIENRNEDLMVLTSEVEQFCKEWEANMKQIYFVTMTVEEICLAIMKKAFEKEGRGYIQITLIALENLEFELHIRDNATLFDPFSLYTKKVNIEGDYDLDAMGMLVIKKKAKSFFYRQYQGYNSLVVKI